MENDQANNPEAPGDPRDDRPRGLYFLTDLANAVRDDPDLPAADLRALLARHGGPELIRTDADADADARELRTATAHLTRILDLDDQDAAADAINALLDRHPPRPRLVRLPGRPWALHTQAPPDAGPTHWLLSTGALALGLWLTERGRCAWGRCAADGCGRYFIDTGRRTPRRYCSPRCATRVRVAAHRTRRSDG